MFAVKPFDLFECTELLLKKLHSQCVLGCSVYYLDCNWFI